MGVPDRRLDALAGGGVTGRIIELLKGAAYETLFSKSKNLGLDQLMIAGARLPAIINQSDRHPINDRITSQI